jgi:adenosylhomocysteine nucleosidase
VSSTEADEGLMPRIAVIAALPSEVAGLVRGTRPDRELLGSGIRLHRVGNAVIAAGGMGATRVALALDAALRDEAVGLVISAGLAGSCSAEISAGELVEATVVVDAKTGERFVCDQQGMTGQVLVTTEAIAGVKEKSRLHESYGAGMVDMEAATVARLAAARGVRFRAIKAISDAHDFEMESMSRFADDRGQFRTGAFALHTALRPASWSSAMRLGRDSNRALAKLWPELAQIIQTE